MKKEEKQLIQDHRRSHTIASEHRKNEGTQTSRALARTLRTTSRIVSLAADITEGLEELTRLHKLVPDSFDKALRDIRDSSVKIRAMSGLRAGLEKTSAGSRETGSELLFSIEDISRGFEKIDRSFRKTVSSIIEEEQLDVETGRVTGDLEKTIEPAFMLAERTRKIADRADIAGLNASLEAGRAGKKGEAFAIIASATQKTAIEFIQIADECDTLVAAMKTRVADVGKKHLRSSERVRTVSVLANSIAATFDEAGGYLDTVREQADALSLAIDENGPLSEGMAETESSLAALMTESESEIAEIAGMYNGIGVSPADLLATAHEMERSAALISGENRDASGDVCDTGEQLTRLLDQRGEALSHVSEPADHIGEMFGRIEKSAQEFGDRIGVARSSLETIRKRSSATLVSLDSFRSRLTDTSAVLKELARELSGLKREERGFADAAQSLVSTLSRFDALRYELGIYISQMEWIVLTGKLELVHSGADNPGLTAFIQEVGTLAKEALTLAGDIRSFALTAADKASGIDKAGIKEWDVMAALIKTVVDECEGLTGATIRGASDSVTMLDHLSAEQDQHLRGLMERKSSLADMLSTVTAAAEEARSGIQKQQELMDKMIEAADKTIALAESLLDSDED